MIQYQQAKCAIGGVLLLSNLLGNRLLIGLRTSQRTTAFWKLDKGYELIDLEVLDGGPGLY